MSIPLSFLEPARNLRLAKVITQDGSTPYPNVKTLTSHTYYLEAGRAGLEEAYKLLQAHAVRGHCVHKGVLKEPIINESRRGKSDANAPTNLLVIDLDDYIPEVLLPTSGITSHDLRATVEALRVKLPAPLNTTACIANASSSTGMKANGVIGLHLFFLLEKSVPVSQLTHWLTGLNFCVESFVDQIKLNRSGMSVKWVCDPVVARNSQLIYIAPPELSGIADPFATPSDRWALIEGSNAACDMHPLLTELIPATVQQQAERVLAELRKSSGLKRMTPRYRRLDIDGQKLQVLTNPDQMQMTLLRTTDKYAYWNINGGDSNAYYNPIGNPEIIFNFKNEPPFELKQANEDIYNWYCEQYKTQIRDTSDPRPLAFREVTNDQHYAVEYNPREDRIIRVNKIARQNIEDWCATYGMPVADPMPQWDVLFDPSSTVVLDWDNHKLNLFQPTDLLRNPPAILPTYANRKLGEAKEALSQLCPYIHRVLYHICGNGDLEYEWFVNWLAFTVQTRKKVETAWVFSGVPGTGKGIFFDRILRPIIGDKYSSKKRLDHLEEQFNAYLQQTLFLVYEEFRLSDSKQDGKLLNKLKDEIGGTTTNIRAMRTDVVEVPNYTNYIFFSNHLDAIRIEEGDRRFNIGPAQLIPLRAVWPKVTEELPRLDGELGTFVGFLMAYAANEQNARTPIENAAKRNMQQLAMGYNERFCLALRKGELDYFLDVFDMDVANDINKATQITTAQKYVRSWAEAAQAGAATVIPSSDMLTVYLAMHDSRGVTQTKFGLMLGRNDIQTRRARVRKRQTTCLDVTWHSSLGAEELAELATPSIQNVPAHVGVTHH